MRFHNKYNVALRLSGLLFQVLLLTTPPLVALLLMIATLNPTWPLSNWLDPVINWSLVMGAIATLLLFLGSLWDAR